MWFEISDQKVDSIEIELPPEFHISQFINYSKKLVTKKNQRYRFYVQHFQLQKSFTLILRCLKSPEKTTEFQIPAVARDKDGNMLQIFNLKTVVRRPDINIKVNTVATGAKEGYLEIILKSEEKMWTNSGMLKLRAILMPENVPIPIKTKQMDPTKYIEEITKLPEEIELDHFLGNLHLIIPQGKSVRLAFSFHCRDISGNKYETDETIVDLNPEEFLYIAKSAHISKHNLLNDTIFAVAA